jgi:hypothetical protein
MRGVKCHFCKKPGTGLYDGLFMCTECRAEAIAMDEAYAAEAARKAAGVTRFRALAVLVRKWLWVPNAAFVACAVIYLGWKFGGELIDWIRVGGMQ